MQYYSQFGFLVAHSHTTYTDRMVLKSGWDEIEGNKMTEI